MVIQVHLSLPPLGPAWESLQYKDHIHSPLIELAVFQKQPLEHSKRKTLCFLMTLKIATYLRFEEAVGQLALPRAHHPVP